MKNFIKKYPKRIFISALVVLLIAIVGTVNNYRTYRTSGIDEKLYNLLVDAYGTAEIEVKKRGEVYAIFDELNRYEVYPDYVTVHKNLTRVDFELNDDKFSADDTLMCTVTNINYNYVEVYLNQYKVQINYDGKWYTLRPGYFEEGEHSESIRLQRGESYEFSVPLEYISEYTDEPVKLMKSKYRICTLVALKSDREDIEPAKSWLGCEFEIK